MKSKTLTIILISLFIFGVLIYFFAFSGSSTGKVISDQVQKVNIGMKDYNYYPTTITVKEGQPVEITLDNSVGGCYRSFNIPQFGISQYSSSSSDKIIFTPTQKGTFQFRCGMGMGRGTIIVQ